MSSNVERMKKLYALALRGVGGEKEQAAAILESRKEVPGNEI